MRPFHVSHRNKHLLVLRQAWAHPLLCIQVVGYYCIGRRGLDCVLACVVQVVAFGLFFAGAAPKLGLGFEGLVDVSCRPIGRWRSLRLVLCRPATQYVTTIFFLSVTGCCFVAVSSKDFPAELTAARGGLHGGHQGNLIINNTREPTLNYDTTLSDDAPCKKSR